MVRLLEAMLVAVLLVLVVNSQNSEQELRLKFEGGDEVVLTASPAGGLSIDTRHGRFRVAEEGKALELREKRGQPNRFALDFDKRLGSMLELSHENQSILRSVSGKNGSIVEVPIEVRGGLRMIALDASGATLMAVLDSHAKPIVSLGPRSSESGPLLTIGRNGPNAMYSVVNEGAGKGGVLLNLGDSGVHLTEVGRASARHQIKRRDWAGLLKISHQTNSTNCVKFQGDPK